MMPTFVVGQQMERSYRTKTNIWWWTFNSRKPTPQAGWAMLKLTMVYPPIAIWARLSVWDTPIACGWRPLSISIISKTRRRAMPQDNGEEDGLKTVCSTSRWVVSTISIRWERPRCLATLCSPTKMWTSKNIQAVWTTITVATCLDVHSHSRLTRNFTWFRRTRCSTLENRCIFSLLPPLTICAMTTLLSCAQQASRLISMKTTDWHPSTLSTLLSVYALPWRNICSIVLIKRKKDAQDGSLEDWMVVLLFRSPTWGIISR